MDCKNQVGWLENFQQSSSANSALGVYTSNQDPIFNQNARGFALVWLLIALPVLLSLFFWFFGSFDFLRAHSNLNHACREILLKAQQKNLDQIEAILEMNPGIRAAWIAHDSAQAAFYAALATGNPKAIAAARKLYKKAKKTIQTMRTYQKGLFFKAHLERVQNIQKAHQILRSSRELKLSRQTNRVLQLQAGKVALKEKPSSRQELPEYELETSFSELQKITLKWQMIAQFSDRISLKGSGTKPSIRQEFLCGATIKNQRSKLRAVYWIESPKESRSWFSQIGARLF